MEQEQGQANDSPVSQSTLLFVVRELVSERNRTERDADFKYPEPDIYRGKSMKEYREWIRELDD